jgi:hypothetical protein
MLSGFKVVEDLKFAVHPPFPVPPVLKLVQVPLPLSITSYSANTVSLFHTRCSTPRPAVSPVADTLLALYEPLFLKVAPPHPPLPVEVTLVTWKSMLLQ